MKGSSFKGKNRVASDSPESSNNLARRLADLSKMRDTPALIAYLANDRARLLLCKALVSPVTASDRQLVERAHRILRSQGMDPEGLKNRLEPAALALGLVSTCDAQIDYYQVLGVKPSATASELRAAYRRKAFELHPDTARQGTGNGADFLTVKAAYDTLTNPDSRAAFDQCRIALDAWHEEKTGERSDERGRKQSPGKVRKAFFRVAAVVVVMVGVAWVISIVYEHETLVEMVEVTSSTDTARAPEAGRADDAAGVEKKVPAAPERVEEKTMSKPAANAPVLEKQVFEKQVFEKPALEKAVPEPFQTAAVLTKPRKIENGSTVAASAPANTAVLTAPESVEATETVKTQNVLKERAPAALKLAGPEPAQIALSVVPKAPEKPPEKVSKAKDVPKIKKEKPIEAIEVAANNPSNPVVPEHSKLPESKGTEDREVKAPAALKLPAVDEKKPDAELAQVFTVKVAPAAEQVEAQTQPAPEPAETALSAVPEAPERQLNDVWKHSKLPDKITESPVQPKKREPAQFLPTTASVRLEENSPIRVFPDIPIPKIDKTPLVKRSQVVEFLKDYTAAYEKGNAAVFFSFFTDNALENGKPLKSIKPDYLEIWEKVQRLNYRISVNETEQVVDSELVSMKGRFDLAWKFLDGGNGHSQGEIFMDLRVNKDALRISRLDYRFDEP